MKKDNSKITKYLNNRNVNGIYKILPMYEEGSLILIYLHWF